MSRAPRSRVPFGELVVAAMERAETLVADEHLAAELASLHLGRLLGRQAHRPRRRTPRQRRPHLRVVTPARWSEARP